MSRRQTNKVLEHSTVHYSTDSTVEHSKVKQEEYKNTQNKNNWELHDLIDMMRGSG